jgi:hypothetical protein
MKYALFTVGGLMALVACATNSESASLGPDTDVDQDGGAPVEDAGPSDGSTMDATGDAERPLVCGDAGFCETRIPTSDLGLPLVLRGVWVVSPNDVWTVSAEGLVLHYDGASWTTVYRAHHALYAVWGTATSVWVGGEGGLLVHKSVGGEWTRVETGQVRTIHAIFGTADDDVWFPTGGSSLDHFDGAALTNLSIDIPGLQTTTVFGRTGFGIYAAGYVNGPPEPSEQGIREHIPYVVEISGASTSIFNASLQAQRGFVPVSGVVTDAPDESQRILLVGYADTGSSSQYYYCNIGATNSPTLRPLGQVASITPSWKTTGVLDVPMWAHQKDAIYMQYATNALFRWTGSSFTSQSLNMGSSFVPRAVFGIHGDTAQTWLVGDGFALKGPTQ